MARIYGTAELKHDFKKQKRIERESKEKREQLAEYLDENCEHREDGEGINNLLNPHPHTSAVSAVLSIFLHQLSERWQCSTSCSPLRFLERIDTPWKQWQKYSRAHPPFSSQLNLDKVSQINLAHVQLLLTQMAASLSCSPGWSKYRSLSRAQGCANQFQGSDNSYTEYLQQAKESQISRREIQRSSQ